MINNVTGIIIDDEPKAVRLLSACLAQLFPSISVTHGFTRWSDALSQLRTRPPDILFMDISMPEKTGFDLLALLPKLKTEVIFVTAHAEHALSSFRFTPSGYILKPIDDEQLVDAVSVALKRVEHKKNAATLILPKDNSSSGKIGIANNKGTDYINQIDILYMESVNHCTRIVTANGRLMSSYALARFKPLLEKQIFMQVHRSYIINIDCVKRYAKEGTVELNNGDEIPISKGYRDEFLMSFSKND